MSNSSTSEWGVRIGPIRRNNTAGTRQQAEEGAQRMVMEAANALLQASITLGPELVKGVVAPTGCSDPELAQESAEVELSSYQLPNGSWFTLATSNVFGFKVVCKKLAD